METLVYIANFINSDMDIGDIRSMCPLAGKTEILYFSEHYQKYIVSPIDCLYQNNLRSNTETIKVLANGKEVECRINKFNIPSEYEITLVNGHKIQTTANHLNKTLRGNEIPTCELTANDYLPFSVQEFRGNSQLTKEEGILVGMFLGDGSFTKNGICFSLNHKKKKELVDWIESFAPHKFGAKVRKNDNVSEISGENSCVNVYVYSKYLRGLIDQCVTGTDALTKGIDGWCFNKSIEFRQGIVEGLYKTDGGNRNRIYTSSPKLKNDLVTLLATLGIVCSVNADDRDGRLGRNTCYTIRYYQPHEHTGGYGDVYKTDKENNLLWFKIKEVVYKKHNSAVNSYCLEIIDKTKEPVFMLANGILTHNCRMALSLEELRKKNGGLFGAGDSTGSIGVVTINLPRLGYQNAGNEKKFFKELSNILVTAKDSLEIKRQWLTENVVNKNLIPAFNTYVGGLKNYFSTIGVVGMNEMCENFFGEGTDILTKRGYNFSIKVSEFIRSKLVELQKETGNLWNYEATPAESTSYRLAKKDREEFDDIITRGTSEAPYYTNSCHIPVSRVTGINSTFEHQDELQNLFTGGTVIHCFLDGAITGSQAKQVIKAVCEKFKTPYISLSPLNRYCPTHGYVDKRVDECPECGNKLELYQRITGYLRRVDFFNPGKRAEFEERKQLQL